MKKVLLLVLVPMLLQGTPQTRQQQPTFRARVDQVLIDVVVTDRNDRPITDLTAADFEIRENGRLQTINDFQFVSIPVSTAPIEAETPEERAEVALPDVATNAPPSPNSRLFVLVIDDLHILESEIIPVKRIVTDFVTALGPDDEVGVVFTGRSDLAINITRDRARLLAAIDRIRDAMGFGLDALHRLPGAGDPITDSMRKLQYNVPAQYLASSLRTLSNVGDALAASPHPRRAIVFVSAGSALDFNLSAADAERGELGLVRGIVGEVRKVFEKLRRANVPTYTLDPRGHTMPEDAVRGGIGTLGGLNTDVSVGSKAPVGTGRNPADLRAEVARRIKIQQNNLSELAINTGGRAFINQSNLSRAVNEIVAENGSYYLLAYTPVPLGRDGRFHEVDIRVTREGVRVRGRNGYVAPSAQPESTDPAATLKTAIESAINVSGLGLRAVATPVARGSKGMITAVSLQVTYPMVPGSTTPIDDVLRLNLTALDPEAKVKATAEHAFAFKASPIDADHVTFTVNGTIELPPQALTLRAGLASRSLGRAGMVQVPVHAPDQSDDTLQMSGIAIGLEGRTEPSLGGSLIAPHVPFQPTTLRRFGTADTLTIYTRLFWESKDENVDLTFGVTGPREIEPRTVQLAAASDGNRRSAAFAASVPLRRLSAGEYVLRVAARLANGQMAHRNVPFSIR